MNVYHNNLANRSPLNERLFSETMSHTGFLFDDKSVDSALYSIQLEKQFSSGDTLFREGDFIDYYYYIQQGNLKGYKLLSNGREQITRFIINTDLLFFPALESYGYSAEVLTPIDVILYPKQEFDKLIERHNVMKQMVFQVLTDELTASQQQVLLLGRMAAAERVSTFLYDILQRIIPDFEDCPDPIEVILPMTRADIADYLGLTIETVSRVFSKLRSDKVITLPKPNKVQFNDPRKLIAEKA